jgi:hypothetical protein
VRALSAPVLAVVAFLTCTTQAAAAADPDEITVTAGHTGDVVTIDVGVCVLANAEEAWDVLTDFEHMAEIVSNLESSRVLRRSGNSLIVSQRGRANRGPLSFSFDTVRLVDLDPQVTIHSRLLSGSLKGLDGETRLVQHGARTLITNHGEFVPDVGVPPIIGIHFIEAEARNSLAKCAMK